MGSFLESLDKRPRKGHGLLDRFGTALLFLLAVAGLSALVAFFIVLRQAGNAWQREAIKSQQRVPRMNDERPVSPPAGAPETVPEPG